MPQPVRVPQEERTRVMRLRLLNATIESLVELGWSGTTTTEVSKRAGVSRGAQLHHFPNKHELVTAAVRHLAELRRSDIEEALAPDGPALPIRDALEMLTQQFIGPVFFAALELWVAARTDMELRPQVAALERELGRETHRLTVAVLRVDDSIGRNRQLVQGTLDMLRGLSLAASLTDDSTRRAAVLDAWAQTLENELKRS